MIWNFTKFLLCPCRSRRHFLKIQSQCVAFISYESPTQKYEPNQCFLSMSLAILKRDCDPSRSQTLRGKSIPLAIAQNCFSCKNSERQHVNMSLWSMRSIMTIQTNKRFAQLLLDDSASYMRRTELEKIRQIIWFHLKKKSHNLGGNCIFNI